MLLYQGQYLLIERKLRFLYLMYDKFRFDGDFCSKVGCQRGEKRQYRFFLTKWAFSLFFEPVFSFSLPKDSSLIWYLFCIHEERLSTSRELPRVNFVKCVLKTKYANNMKLPRIFSQGVSPFTRLWHLADLLTFIRKLVFLNKSEVFLNF